MNRTRWILVVDDDENDLMWTLEALERQTTPVGLVALHDGIEALDYLYSRGEYSSRPPGNPEMILMDIHMPRADGFDVLRQVKGDAYLRSIPTILFSSSRRADDVARAYQLGANAYVVKPVDYRQFVNTVDVIRNFWTACNEAPPRYSRPVRAMAPEVPRTETNVLLAKH
jgi:CheY-like chemotaxis protein